MKMSVMFIVAALVPIVLCWKCGECGADNPEVREICWLCGGHR